MAPRHIYRATFQRTGALIPVVYYERITEAETWGRKTGENAMFATAMPVAAFTVSTMEMVKPDTPTMRDQVSKKWLECSWCPSFEDELYPAIQTELRAQFFAELYAGKRMNGFL